MKKLLRNKLLGAACLLLLPLGAGAQVQLDSVGRDAKYVNNIIARSQKIVDALQLTDKSCKQNVLHIICNRYFLLNDIYEKFGKNKAERDAELYKHHFEFAANLENYLSEKQVEQVKDGMTFGVVPKTYQAHLEMIPSLKENSKAKHGWFGKYKGRINNWLTKRGYDLKAEREGWYKRIEAAKKK